MMRNPSIDHKPYVGTPPTESGLRRRRIELTIDPAVADLARKVADDRKVSFSQLVEQLLRAELEQQGLVGRQMNSNRRSR